MVLTLNHGPTLCLVPDFERLVEEDGEGEAGPFASPQGREGDAGGGGLQGAGLPTQQCQKDTRCSLAGASTNVASPVAMCV